MSWGGKGGVVPDASMHLGDEEGGEPDVEQRRADRAAHDEHEAHQQRRQVDIPVGDPPPAGAELAVADVAARDERGGDGVEEAARRQLARRRGLPPRQHHPTTARRPSVLPGPAANPECDAGGLQRTLVENQEISVGCGQISRVISGKHDI